MLISPGLRSNKLSILDRHKSDSPGRSMYQYALSSFQVGEIPQCLFHGYKDDRHAACLAKSRCQSAI